MCSIYRRHGFYSEYKSSCGNSVVLLHSILLIVMVFIIL